MNGNTRNSNIVGNGNSNTSTATMDDIEELEALVNLPFHPDEALWRDDPAEGTERPRKLTSVLKFLPAESPKVFELIAKSGDPSPFEIEVEAWFPPELVAKSQESGNATIKGTSYRATDFARPPFAEGRISRIEGTDFYILELYAK